MSAYSSIHNKHSYESISPGKHSSSAKASPQVAFDSYDSSIDDIRSTDCKKEGALQSAMEVSFAGVQSKLLRNESRRKSFRGVAKMNQLMAGDKGGRRADIIALDCHCVYVS